ncbi:hypothetical protein [Nitrosomonas aestuarii]|uniref:hypothetical protein n=1 Tax=Nitrosomonas aestuarii TaxID=52441 RepID=UPI000D3216A9|nr:hypothetical protein [Nitrosomonas aestuarii]
MQYWRLTLFSGLSGKDIGKAMPERPLCLARHLLHQLYDTQSDYLFALVIRQHLNKTHGTQLRSNDSFSERDGPQKTFYLRRLPTRPRVKI